MNALVKYIQNTLEDGKHPPVKTGALASQMIKKITQESPQKAKS